MRQNKMFFKIVVYVMVASLLLSTLLFSVGLLLQ